MAYTTQNFPTKKAFKAAVAEGVQVEVYNPSGMFPTKSDGIEFVEGPHYPKPHSWYAQVTMRDGVVVKVQ